MFLICNLEVFILLLGLSTVVALHRPLFHASTLPTSRQSQNEKNIRCTAVDGGDHDAKISLDLEAYLGPSSTADDMEAGCSIEDLGAAIEVSDGQHYSSYKCRMHHHLE
jgi:hypothetical protein